MAKKNGFFDRYRFVYKPSPILLKCAVLTMLVLAIGALTILRVRTVQTNQRRDAARFAASQYEQKNDTIDYMIENKDTVDGVKTIAEEKMGRAPGDTVIYDVVTNQD